MWVTKVVSKGDNFLLRKRDFKKLILQVIKGHNYQSV